MEALTRSLHKQWYWIEVEEEADMHDRDLDLRTIASRLFLVAAELLPTARDLVGLSAVLSAFDDSAEELAGHRPVACSAGCPHCCVLNVAVLLPEAAVIAGWLELHTRGDERLQLLRRLQQQAGRVRWMADDERIHRRVVCPLLDADGRCAVYPVRPLACRGVTSLDRDVCSAAFDPSNLEGGCAVPVDTARKTAMDAAFCALARALEQQGIVSRSIELSAGVASFLENPGLVAELLQGAALPDRLWEQ